MIEERKLVSWEIWEQQVLPTLVENPKEALTYLFHETVYEPQAILKKLATLPEFQSIDLINPDKEKQLNKIKKQLLRNLSGFIGNKAVNVLKKLDLPFEGYIHLLRLAKIKDLENLFKKLEESNEDFRTLIWKRNFKLKEKGSFSEKEEALSAFFLKEKKFISQMEDLFLTDITFIKSIKELELFSGLTRIDFSHNINLDLPENFGDHWPLLEELDLRGCDLRVLRRSFGNKWTRLKRCNLSNNRLKWLPSLFGNKWKKIQEVNLSGNELTSFLSTDFGEDWTYLKDIDLSGNQLKELPSSFGENWKKLKFLKININKIKILPNKFGKNWTMLLEAYLSENKIKEVPEKLGKNWRNLKCICLNWNKINTLPTEFGKNWPANCQVGLRDNCVYELSLPVIENLQKLKGVDLKDNLLPENEIENFGSFESKYHLLASHSEEF